MPQMTVNGTSLYYEQTGDGPETIVFAHGCLLSCRMFDGMVAILKEHYRCVTFDFRGQGRSEIPASDYDLDSLAEDTAELIRLLGCAPCHFLGFSMGGFVGMRLAVEHPELLRSLILVGTSASPEPHSFRYRMLCWLAWLFGPRCVTRWGMPVQFGPVFLNDPRRTEERQLWYERMADNDRLGSTHAASGVIGRPDYSSHLSRVHVPTLIVAEHTVYVIDLTRSGQPARRILGHDYGGIMIHDGWSPYDGFLEAHHQQCLAHLLRRCNELLETAEGGAGRFPRQIKELLHQAFDLRDRHEQGELSTHGLAVSRGRLHNQLMAAIVPADANAANERLAQHLWKHRNELLTFLRFPGLDATNWRAELAIRHGVILRKVWGGNRTWIGARAQAVLMSVARTCWQRGQNVVTFLSHLLRRFRPEFLAFPP